MLKNKTIEEVFSRKNNISINALYNGLKLLIGIITHLSRDNAKYANTYLLYNQCFAYCCK